MTMAYLLTHTEPASFLSKHTPCLGSFLPCISRMYLQHPSLLQEDGSHADVCAEGSTPSGANAAVDGRGADMQATRAGGGSHYPATAPAGTLREPQRDSQAGAANSPTATVPAPSAATTTAAPAVSMREQCSDGQEKGQASAERETSTEQGDGTGSAEQEAGHTAEGHTAAMPEGGTGSEAGLRGMSLLLFDDADVMGEHSREGFDRGGLATLLQLAEACRGSSAAAKRPIILTSTGGWEWGSSVVCTRQCGCIKICDNIHAGLGFRVPPQS